MKDNFFSEEVMSGNFLETIQLGRKPIRFHLG